MSRLRLFQPDVLGFDDDVDVPEVIPFNPHADRFASLAPADFGLRGNGSQFDVLQRSRVIHDNRQCPSCHHPVVAPLELRDGRLNRNGMPVPGTATLVGFCCDRCEYEWPA